MAWFLALQGPPSKAGQSPTYELQDSADIDQLAREMAAAVPGDGIVEVPASFNSGRQRVTVYLRPAAWGAWAFYEMSEAERREMMASNPVLNALAQAQAQQKQQPRRQQPPSGPSGPSSIPRLQ